MTNKRIAVIVAAVLTILLTLTSLWLVGDAGAGVLTASPQQGGSPMLINFQGELTDTATGDPVPDGDYSITFTIYNADTGGSNLWSETQTVGVEDGLFSVLLGSQTALTAEVFNGDPRWVGVRVESDAEMTPRQRIVSAAYAIQAEHAASAPWSGLTGVPTGLDDGDDDTTYTNGTGLILSGAEFSLVATCRLPQTCSNGQIAEWNGSAWVCGDDDTGAGGDSWSLTGNAGTTSGTNFLGTTDNQALELHVNGSRALRLEPDATSPNFIGGYSGNSVTAGVVGGTIGGGGSVSFVNQVTADYGTIGGGENNTTSGDYATVGGGWGNTASGWDATISGGGGNTASGRRATVGGGIWNTAAYSYTTIGGGKYSQATADYATIAGGGSDSSATGNRVTDEYGTVVGGYNNQASDNAGTTTDAPYATVGGGQGNIASGYENIVGGGYENIASGIRATGGGGVWNGATDNWAGGGGGACNTAGGTYATVGGGFGNEVTICSTRADPDIYYVREGDSIQQAINQAIAPGDEVWVATSVYTENLVITHSVKLRGGWDVSFTVQSPATYPTTIDGSGTHVISATVESGSASIGGFTIRNGRDGVRICSGVFTLTHNLVYSMAVQGIEVTTGTVWIVGNTISDTDEEGIRINGGTAVLSANLVYDTGRDGIHTGDLSAHVEIRGNTVYGTARDGIDGRGHKVVIASNTVYDTGRDGVHVEDAGTAHIQHNVVYSMTNHGIYARDVVSLITIVDNTVYDTGSDGIHTHQSSANVEIQSNTIYDTGGDGVDARGATVTVANNTINVCADNGIKAEEAGYTFINANQVYGAGDAGIDLDNAGAFTVTNNVVAGSSVASVLIQTGAGSHNFLYHNTLVGSTAGPQGDGISVTVAGITVTLVNNIVVSHSVGIAAMPGATLVVSHTLLCCNGSDPISGAGVITGDPLFVAPAQQDYHLLPGSPAVDAGIDIGVTSDVDGAPRPIGALPDIGADEWVEPCNALTGVSINGPTTGYTGALYAFTAVITPSDATAPITYTWSSDGLVSGQGTANVSYEWATPGAKSITLYAENCGGTVGDTHAIVISTPPAEGDAYETDDTCAQASFILTDGTVQFHTFHQQADTDWVMFDAISGATYLVEALTPITSTADVVLEIYDACDALPTDSQGYDFSPDVRLQFQAPADGIYYLHLFNQYPDTAGPDVTYHLSVRALADEPTPGALVLVAGRYRLSDPLQSNIHNVTNSVYRLFQANGYDGERIYYLATDLNLDADGDTWPDVDAWVDRTKLEQAITQWASDKVGPDRAFTLYLMDHGDPDVFYLDGPSQTVDPDDVDGWLDTLEAAAPGVKVNVIVEACYAGSFIDLDESLSKEGRVVIASTTASAPAWSSPNGAVFSDAFVDALGRGMSLGASFEEGKGVASARGQIPWLDDDGDGTPNETEDGQEAARRGFAYAGTLAGPEKWPPYVVWAQVGQVQASTGVITAEVQDDKSVLSTWAVVYKPSYVPPEPGPEMVQETLPTVMLLDQNGDDVYTGLYEGFDEVGEYRIVVYAVDGEGFEGRPREVEVRTGWLVYLPVVMRQ